MISARPSFNGVTVNWYRGAGIGAVVSVKLPVAGSNISAVASTLPEMSIPPAIRTFPDCSFAIPYDARPKATIWPGVSEKPAGGGVGVALGVAVGVGVGVAVSVGVAVADGVGVAVRTIISVELPEPPHAAAQVAKAVNIISFARGRSGFRERIRTFLSSWSRLLIITRCRVFNSKGYL